LAQVEHLAPQDVHLTHEEFWFEVLVPSEESEEVVAEAVDETGKREQAQNDIQIQL